MTLFATGIAKPLVMREATDEDKAAARRILGLLPQDMLPSDSILPRAAAWRNPPPPSLIEGIDAFRDAFRDGESPQRREPSSTDRHGYRMWNVVSESMPDNVYEVIERADTKNGGTYFFCTCKSWPMMRGKGRDCKHIQEVIA